MSLIGKEYIPIDNSYSINITKPTKYDKIIGLIENKKYLAGTNNGKPLKSIIKSLPIKMLIDTTVNPNNPTFTFHTMIVVQVIDTQEYHLVMYHKEGLNREI